MQNPPPRNAPFADPNNEHVFALIWSLWFGSITQAIDSLQEAVPAGFTGVVTTAKLTSGGTNGSMTFASGVLTAQVAAT